MVAVPRITMLAASPSRAEADRPLSLPILVAAVRSFGLWSLRYAPGLSSALDESAADLVHLHGLWMQPSVALMGWRRRTGRPILMSPHGMLDVWALSNAHWKEWIATRLFERANTGDATCLHALNVAEVRAIRAFGLTNPIAVIPSGVDLPDLKRREGWSTEGDRRRVLLLLRRRHPKKGLIESLRAWARLGEIAPGVWRDWRLVIPGWDGDSPLAQVREPGQEWGESQEQTDSVAVMVRYDGSVARSSGPFYSAALTQAKQRPLREELLMPLMMAQKSFAKHLLS